VDMTGRKSGEGGEIRRRTTRRRYGYK